METEETPVYVFQLPAKLISEIAASLDPGDCWEIMASIMPGIQYIDIEACRRLSNNGGHPTETILRIWGSKGYTILDLYKVFFMAKLLRCMQILLPFVDAKFHKYAQICADESDQLLPHQQSPRSVRNSNLSKPIHQSISKKNSIGVYSRKGFSSAGLDGAGLPASSAAADQQSSPNSNAPNNLNNFDQNGTILSGLQNTLAVKYEDIVAATNGFSAENILGKGGYGVVYRGIWKHTEVAIKRIQGKREGGGEDRQQKERIRQSLQELRTLAKFRHDNILSLYGYSLDGSEPCLIYQFMSNGSLEDRLLCKNGTEPLNWPRKLAICKGISCGLHFLHSIGTMPIIHGDVKSANILLDKHFDPKLGDFGLSRDGQIEGGESGGDKRPMIASHVKGTLAYLPPEFTTSRILTTKLDVYSFGVVLLEMGTGQRAFTSSRDPQSLVDFTRIHFADKNSTPADVEKLADKRTPNLAENRQIFEKLLTIGLSCTEKNRFSRPTFSEIFAQLN